jgi:hypothetical protein
VDLIALAEIAAQRDAGSYGTEATGAPAERTKTAPARRGGPPTQIK